MRLGSIINELNRVIIAEDGEIIVSSILPRTDHMAKVNEMNSLLHTMTEMTAE